MVVLFNQDLIGFYLINLQKMRNLLPSILLHNGDTIKITLIANGMEVKEVVEGQWEKMRLKMNGTLALLGTLNLFHFYREP